MEVVFEGFEFISTPSANFKPVNRPGFDGGCILWEDVAHGSIEAGDDKARIGTSTPA